MNKQEKINQLLGIINQIDQKICWAKFEQEDQETIDSLYAEKDSLEKELADL